ncbi:MAG: hypothetical protein ROO76_11160 [Terriglobia bacterium]|nr:hypothetical protein [Terriglobia bacterium]
MFGTLLIVTFLVAAATAVVTAVVFSVPVKKIMARLVSDELAPIWRRYIMFAVLVVGIAGGVRVWDLEKYITPDKDGKLLALTSQRWGLEIYKTVIGSLQSVTWMLLIFFLFTLIAYVVVRGFELRKAAHS